MKKLLITNILIIVGIFILETATLGSLRPWTDMGLGFFFVSAAIILFVITLQSKQ